MLGFAGILYVLQPTLQSFCVKSILPIAGGFL